FPALKSPVAFHKQIHSLQRARTGTFLKHKLSSRPDRSELVRMHILEETQAEPSLQATQLRLKRARLANDLNEKIAQRPGPMELVEKKILPVDSGVEEVINSKPVMSLTSGIQSCVSLINCLCLFFFVFFLVSFGNVMTDNVRAWIFILPRVAAV
uniref:Phosphatase and actin regulator n=1 Tax=Poecilia latipinna TaxID=48699 RepID=A0A3B3V493_9TELE